MRLLTAPDMAVTNPKGTTEQDPTHRAPQGPDRRWHPARCVL